MLLYSPHSLIIIIIDVISMLFDANYKGNRDNFQMVRFQ